VTFGRWRPALLLLLESCLPFNLLLLLAQRPVPGISARLHPLWLPSVGEEPQVRWSSLRLWQLGLSIAPQRVPLAPARAYAGVW
jgi:hypothetical protein